MIRTILVTAAAIAITSGTASAQFLLFSDENDQKLVVNEYAGEIQAQVGNVERLAARIPGGPAIAFEDADEGQLLFSDPLSDEKVVVNRSAGERLHMNHHNSSGTSRPPFDRLTQGAPGGSDANGNKVVVGESDGRSSSLLR